jgi:hypothetical protein
VDQQVVDGQSLEDGIGQIADDDLFPAPGGPLEDGLLRGTQAAEAERDLEAGVVTAGKRVRGGGNGQGIVRVPRPLIAEDSCEVGSRFEAGQRDLLAVAGPLRARRPRLAAL